MQELALNLEDTISILGTESSIKDLTELLVGLAKQVHDSYKSAYTAIYEALRNAWQHAHKKEPKKIRVNYSITQDKFVITVIDQGPGFNYSRIRKLVEERKKKGLKISLYEMTGMNNGGLGLGTILMHEYANEVKYRSGGSKVVLVKFPDPIMN